jgi:alpha-beta hydrolase superfamily lysophospholipase
MREVPRDRSGGYLRAISNKYDGEWTVDEAWKPLRSWPAHAGWLRAIRRGQARLGRGVTVQAPVLLVSSARSGPATPGGDPALRNTDVVLDVERMRRKAVGLSRHVTVAQVEGAMHDTTLSPEPVRTRVFDEIGRWLSAYVEK